MKNITFLVLSLCAASVFAQDIHFSQTSQTPLFINPAAAGVYDGWERVIINHRNQWLGSGTQFMTSAVAFDANIGKTRKNETPFLGVSALFYNDIGGDSKFGQQTGSLGLSGVIPMAGTGHLVSAGIQGSFSNRSADYSRLLFSSQWTGTAFDANLLTGEQNGANFRYADVAGGLFYTFDAGGTNFRRREEFKIQAGVSGYHLNKPTMKFASVEGDRLNRKWIMHASVVADIPGSPLAVDGNVVQVFQGPHTETILGAMARYRLIDGTHYTGYSQPAYIGLGAYYRVGDAICPAFIIDIAGFKFGVSYDYTISSMRKAYTGGSLEFSLSYTNLSHALFKWKGRR